MQTKSPNAIAAARDEAANKRISSCANTYVIRENKRKGTVTVRTASGVHIATMRRSAAIRDGLIEADRSAGAAVVKPKAKVAKHSEPKSRSFAHLANASEGRIVDRNSESRADASGHSWAEALRKAARNGTTSR